MTQFKNLYTEFDNFNVSAGAPNSDGLMLTKINYCVDIQWIANSTQRNMTGVKLDINEDLELIYVTGNFEFGATLNAAVDEFGSPVCTGGPTSLTFTQPAGAFVAIYNFDGCLVDTLMYQNNASYTIEAQAVATHEFSSSPLEERLYLLLKESSTSSSQKVLRLRSITPVYNPSLVTISLTEEWDTEFVSAVDCNGNDMVSVREKVYFVGDFKRDIIAQGLPGAPGMTTVNASSSDAFVYGISDNGSSPSLLFDQDLYTTAMSNHDGTAMGVTANSGRVYLTGSCVQSAPNAFGGSTTVTNFGSTSTRIGYVLEMNTSGTVSWIHGLSSSGGVAHWVRGQAITLTSNNDLCISGTQNGNSVVYQDYASGTSNLGISTSSGTHLFVLGWDGASAFYTIDEWTNASNMTHKPTNNAIAATNDNVYTTGLYLFTMGMTNTSVGPITSSGAGGNLYIWRNKMQLGTAYRTAESGDDDISSNDPKISGNLEPSFNVSIAPNPAHDILTFRGNLPADVKTNVIDAMGRQIVTIDLNQSKELDVSNLENGMYLIIISGTGFQEKISFIKQ